MKKKGAALVTVLVIFTALIIVGTSISSAVINSTKLNKRYSDTIDLELAAKSGINIIKEDFISKVNNESIKTLDNLNTYIYEVNNGNLNNLFKEYYDNGNIDININLDLDSSDNKNRLKIISTAKKQGKFTIEKVKEDSLLLNIGSESTSTEENGDINTGGDGNSNTEGGNANIGGTDNEESSLVFDKLFNIGGNIKSFGNNNQNAIEYFQYSGTCDLGGNNNKYDSNGNRVLPQRNEDLANINLGINTNEILQYISKYSNETIKTHNRESISADNTTIKYNQLNGDNTNISLKNSSKVLFANGGTSQNSNSIEVVGNSNNNSELIFGGNTTFNTGMNIKNVENSEIIVNGDLNVWNGAFKIENTFNSVFIINGNLKNSGSGIDINLKNSVLIVAGDIEPQNNFKVTLENSAIICLGNLKLNTQINIYNNGDSFIYCGKDFSSNSDIRIYNNNGGYTPNSSVVNNAISKFISN